MGQQEKPRLDDADGNCKQCGHPFDPHIVIAYDVNDFSKGGEIRSLASGRCCTAIRHGRTGAEEDKSIVS